MSTKGIFFIFVGLLQLLSYSEADFSDCNVTHSTADCGSAELTSVPMQLTMSVIHLNLTANSITELRSHSFKHLQELVTLYLSRNGLSRINTATFSELNHLEVLVLSDNALHSFGRDLRTILAPLHSLRYLDLSGNQLLVLHRHTFSAHSQPHLTEVSLARNKLSTIDEFFMTGDSSLRKLNISHNQLEETPTLVSVKKLQVLDLSYNFLTKLDSDMFEDNVELENISLAFNNFSEIPGAALAALQSPKSLDLSGNPLREIIGNSFSPKSAYTGLLFDSLILRHMPMLASIGHHGFSSQSDLTVLRISDNPRFDHIEKSAFDGLTTLMDLDLRNNALISLPPLQLDWEELTSLRLDGNPWRCDCHLGWLKEMLSHHHRNLRDVDFRCDSPARVRGSMFSSLSNAQLTCHEDFLERSRSLAIVIGVTVSVVVAAVALIFAVLFVCFRRRKQSDSSVSYTTLLNQDYEEPHSGDTKPLVAKV